MNVEPITSAQITIADLKIARDVLIGFAGVLVTAIGFLMRTAFKMGKDAQKVATSLDSLTDIKAKVAEIPVIMNRLGMVEKNYGGLRSDIKHLLRGSRANLGTDPPSGTGE